MGSPPLGGEGKKANMNVVNLGFPRCTILPALPCPPCPPCPAHACSLASPSLSSHLVPRPACLLPHLHRLAHLPPILHDLRHTQHGAHVPRIRCCQQHRRQRHLRMSPPVAHLPMTAREMAPTVGITRAVVASFSVRDSVSASEEPTDVAAAVVATASD